MTFLDIIGSLLYHNQLPMRLLIFTILMTIYALRASSVLGYQAQLEMIEEKVGELELSFEITNELPRNINWQYDANEKKSI